MTVAPGGASADLGEVAGLDVRAEAHEPIERRQHTRDRAQQRGLAGAVGRRPRRCGRRACASSRAPALRWGRPRAGGEADHIVSSSRATSPERTGRPPPRPGSGAPAWPALGAPRGRRPQRLQALLVLVHLGVLAVAPIALDELPLARDLLCMVSASLRCRASARLALLEVRGVAAPERPQPAVAQLPDAAHDGVQEGPVVRCHQEGASAAGEVRLQPLERGEVEVVGGLVEQQQVRVVDEQPRQGDAGLLAARQLSRGRSQVAGHTQAGQRLLHALVEW